MQAATKVNFHQPGRAANRQNRLRKDLDSDELFHILSKLCKRIAALGTKSFDIFATRLSDFPCSLFVFTSVQFSSAQSPKMVL
jgi:hypothetical protein